MLLFLFIHERWEMTVHERMQRWVCFRLEGISATPGETLWSFRKKICTFFILTFPVSVFSLQCDWVFSRSNCETTYNFANCNTFLALFQKCFKTLLKDITCSLVTVKYIHTHYIQKQFPWHKEKKYRDVLLKRKCVIYQEKEI